MATVRQVLQNTLEGQPPGAPWWVGVLEGAPWGGAIAHTLARGMRSSPNDDSDYDRTGTVMRPVEGRAIWRPQDELPEGWASRPLPWISMTWLAVDVHGAPIFTHTTPCACLPSHWTARGITWATGPSQPAHRLFPMLAERWLSGAWDAPYVWADDTPQARADHLALACWRREASHVLSSSGPARYVRRVVVRGELITCEASLWLALGEALAGPGGYVGCCAASVHRALTGDASPAPPEALLWSGRATAEAHLSGALLARVDEVLREAGVQVEAGACGERAT